MNWLEVKVDTAPAGLDAVSERLEALGVTGLVIDDEADFHDFLEHNHQYWDYVDDALMQEKRGLSRVTFYLPDDADGEKLLSDARGAFRAGAGEPRLRADSRRGRQDGRLRLGEQLEAVL